MKADVAIMCKTSSEFRAEVEAAAKGMGVTMSEFMRRAALYAVKERPMLDDHSGMRGGGKPPGTRRRTS
ncbi:hypothetical protein [Paraburkholderia sp. D1E]|uniref:hypothetical protein n=1 Tax=Paraburkholderia sp. D1E TaxID=3461398 RepID=UPI004046126B